MIVAPGLRAGVYTTATDGDLRSDDIWQAMAAQLMVSPERATMRQVHGGTVLSVTAPGPQGDGDAMVTRRTGIPLVAFVADCLAVIVESDDMVGVAHGGWRGLDQGIVRSTVEAMVAVGSMPRNAAVGPGIGPCCFEVGPEVAARFDSRHHASTTWGSQSVDLFGVVREQLGPVPLTEIGSCTRCGEDSFSYRADRTAQRMAAITWLTAPR